MVDMVVKSEMEDRAEAVVYPEEPADVVEAVDMGRQETGVSTSRLREAAGDLVCSEGHSSSIGSRVDMVRVLGGLEETRDRSMADNVLLRVRPLVVDPIASAP